MQTVFDGPVPASGPITATVHASTSAKDTDFVLNVTDVDPEARAGALWVAEGARRGRIGSVEADPRAPSTYSEVKLLEPGTIYKWKIAVWPTARVFKKGRRIRIEISSSNFPRYNRNLNTGKGLAGSRATEAPGRFITTGSIPPGLSFPSSRPKRLPRGSSRARPSRAPFGWRRCPAALRL